MIVDHPPAKRGSQTASYNYLMPKCSRTSGNELRDLGEKHLVDSYDYTESNVKEAARELGKEKFNGRQNRCEGR